MKTWEKGVVALGLGGIAGFCFWCAYPGESLGGTLVRGMGLGLILGSVFEVLTSFLREWKGRHVHPHVARLSQQGLVGVTMGLFAWLMGIEWLWSVLWGAMASGVVMLAYGVCAYLDWKAREPLL